MQKKVEKQDVYGIIYETQIVKKITGQSDCFSCVIIENSVCL